VEAASRSGSTGLLEREDEVRALDEALGGAAAGRGSVVVIDGAPGIGKSSLVRAATRSARAHGFTVATARAGELERDFVWGVVRQLLEPVVGDAAGGQIFAGAAGLGRPVFEGGGPQAPAPFGVLHGLFWLVHDAAARAPLLLAVDDAQWSDAASLRWLAYLAPRIADLSVVLVVATRPQAPDEIVRLAADPDAVHRSPRPLSDGAVAALLAARLGDVPEPPFTTACHHVTAGNPFLVGELISSLAADTISPVGANAAHVRDLRPATIARAVLMRLSALPPGARDLARAVAVLDRRAKIRHAAALASLDEGALEEALSALVGAEVLAPGAPLAFVHPLVRSVVYEDLSAPQLQRLHAAAAAALAAEHAPPEAIAPHLLRVEPSHDAWVRGTLAAAADDARRGGAPAVAAEQLRRALLEAPAAAERARLLHSLAVVDFDARGKPALDGFEAALEAADDPRSYGAIAADFGRALHVLGNHPEAARVYDRAFERLDEVDTELARTLEAETVVAALQDLSTVHIAAERLPVAASRLGRGGAPDAMITAALALVTAAAGDPAAVALAERALAGGELYRAEHLQSLALACFALVWSDRLEVVARVWDDRVDDLRREAALPALSFACCFASQAALLAGDPARAEAFARESLTVAPSDWALTPPDPACFLIDALLEQGDVAGADRVLAELDYDAELPQRQGYSTLLMTRARLRIAQQRRDEAVDDLLELGRRSERWGVRNPAAYPWRSTAAVVMLRSDPEQARELAAVELERARAFGAARALGIALRAAGLVAGHDGLDLLRESVATLERSPARLEHARSLAALGSALRRAGRRAEAVGTLREALALASELGGIAVASAVRGELAAAGSRPRRDALRGRDALTASERRVAELAAGGLTNRQIAEKLFVALRTVETHLTSAYRKLGIRSRADLREISW
jgi:DNA-binding CsgD family transcriptional regulator